MKKQLSIFLTIFLILSLGMHFSEWIDHPIKHLLSLPHAGAYGLGFMHPILFTSILYLTVTFILWIIHFMKKRIEKIIH
jgi:hypothetical protein